MLSRPSTPDRSTRPHRIALGAALGAVVVAAGAGVAVACPRGGSTSAPAPAGPRTVLLQGVASGAVLADTGTAPSPTAEPGPTAGRTAQQWALDDAGSGRVRLRNVATGKCLFGGGYLFVRPCDGTPAGRWSLTPQEGGTVVLQDDLDAGQAAQSGSGVGRVVVGPAAPISAPQLVPYMGGGGTPQSQFRTPAAS